MTTRPKPPTLVPGRVKTFIADKGFGFILGADNREYFFHRSALVDDFPEVYPGLEVRFTPGDGPKGPRTENVERA